MVTVDYFSRFPEVTKLTSTTSTAVISPLKAVFSRHGIPETVRNDNGPQYSSLFFARFAESYGFKHSTSSPLYPQSNGQVERTVNTVKSLLERASDPYSTLLSYQATPLLWCDLSPAELSKSHRPANSSPPNGLICRSSRRLTLLTRRSRGRTLITDTGCRSCLKFQMRQMFGSPLELSLFVAKLCLSRTHLDPTLLIHLLETVRRNHRHLNLFPHHQILRKHLQQLLNRHAGLLPDHKLALPLYPLTDWLNRLTAPPC